MASCFLTAWAISYDVLMAKCPPGCACARHRPFSEERRQKISAARAGRPLSEVQRAAIQCPPGCMCGKHDLRNAGQFKRGSTGRPGKRSAATKALLSRKSTVHGYARTPTYVSWRSMRDRCTNPKSVSYPYYGQRGITVCARWASFENFLADMGERPEGKTIDRIDTDGNYEPGNCRWATPSQQRANQRKRRTV